MKCLVACCGYFSDDIVSLISRDFLKRFVIDKFNSRTIRLQIFRFAELCNRALGCKKLILHLILPSN